MISYSERLVSGRLIKAEAEVARLRALLRWEGYSDEEIDAPTPDKEERPDATR